MCYNNSLYRETHTNRETVIKLKADLNKQGFSRFLNKNKSDQLRSTHVGLKASGRALRPLAGAEGVVGCRRCLIPGGPWELDGVREVREVGLYF